MVLVDSNIFIIDRFFPRDNLFPQNKIFVERLGSIDAAVPAMTLLEICGAASFRLPIHELESWLFRFTTIYPVHILDVYGLNEKTAEEWWVAFVQEIAEKLSRRMTFGDAVFLVEAEHYRVKTIVTWNTKDFAHRTRLPVLTPATFVRRR